MINKVIFLFFNICLLGFLFGFNTCNANESHLAADTEIISHDFTTNTAFVESTYLDSFFDRCILLESISEQELSDNASAKLESVVYALCLFNHFSNFEKRNKSESFGPLERNTTPVQHVSRNILFHSLQIYF